MATWPNLSGTSFTRGLNADGSTLEDVRAVLRAMNLDLKTAGILG